MKHELPQLPYNYDALEPFMDARTVEIHHSKHHQAYVDKLNKALENNPELQDKPVEELLKSLDLVPETVRTAVKNNGGGHFNHSLFWKIMKSPKEGGGGEPKGNIAETINQNFGNFPAFRETFTNAATGFFGSGWVWLVSDKSGKLSVLGMPNQDSPVSQGLNPILMVDVWEHAYYLKYQNRRPEYVEAWWNIVNWEEVESNLRRNS